ncbi:MULTISPECIES: EF-hand domain-containing protein [unclassified Streptomyces]|uniref:EF-hand domain-containing protein n=1 Tax=unclassified Streptomyces TaxID=2593676 RepID=UPI0022B604F4|nr:MULTISPECIES: EF-hand domain-containing protein [unclassified Streptomyces]MCZ7414690.1 EF-hand domain-containing protein [Streptomyces sp. WMMC897]MCZ7431619.1 EF-hand domain-containing protein [Streptomyces sp. WMMC1477]
MASMEDARASFDRFDADKDGLVTAEEFKRAMAEMGDPFVTGPVAEAVIAAKDANGDGKLSFEEYWEALRKA